MEDQRDNAMEDFFNKSMEQFNELPSDNVWSGIESELDSEVKSRPWYLRWKWPLLMSFAIVFLSGALVIKNQTNKLETQQFIHNNTPVESTQKEFLVKNQTSDLNIETNNTSSKIYEQNSKPSNKDIITTYQNETKTKTSKQSIFKIEAPSIESSTGSIAIQDDSNKDANSTIAHSLAFSESVNQKSKNSSIKSNTTFLSQSKSLREKNTEIGIEALTSQFLTLDIDQRSIPQFSNQLPQIKVENQKSRFVYRAGLQARYSNTYLKNKNTHSGTESYGFLQEIKITNRLFLTQAINFNVEHYTINETEPLQNVILRQYSDAPHLQDNIFEIESNTEYLDFPLGLRYILGNSTSGWNYFINPSIVWQIYLPQDFTFYGNQNESFVRMDNNIIGYLGSASLAFGFEKKLSKKMHLQIKVRAENSFIPMGIQNEETFSLGLSTALIFGR